MEVGRPEGRAHPELMVARTRVLAAAVTRRWVGRAGSVQEAMVLLRGGEMSMWRMIPRFLV